MNVLSHRDRSDGLILPHLVGLCECFCWTRSEPVHFRTVARLVPADLSLHQAGGLHALDTLTGDPVDDFLGCGDQCLFICHDLVGCASTSFDSIAHRWSWTLHPNVDGRDLFSSVPFSSLALLQRSYHFDTFRCQCVESIECVKKNANKRDGFSVRNRFDCRWDAAAARR